MTPTLDASGRKLAVATALLVVAAGLTAAPKTPVTPQWGRFEQAFSSSVSYTNPVQEVELSATFVSPSGQTNRVDGFWDGGSTWRIRFSPGQPGIWTFRTQSSDPANAGLNNHTGELLCSAPAGDSAFDLRGPVRVARDRRHFERADGTPFFWLADSAWDAARRSTLKDWTTYALIRENQKFAAVQWAVFSGDEAEVQTGFTGWQRVAINPKFFRHLDEKIQALNHAGLLSVIAPFWESNGQPSDALPESQAALLVRYMAARWGADDVAWIIAPRGGSGDSSRASAARWQRIGRDVFGDVSHAPVVLFAGQTPALLGSFRHENWVDVFGYGVGAETNNASLRWRGSLIAGAWRTPPLHPFINVVPPGENEPAAAGRVSADDIRKAVWSSVLSAPIAGASYAVNGVSDWNTTPGPKTPDAPANALPFWQKALFLPGAKQMTLLGNFFSTNAFWLFRPAPELLANQ